MGGAAGTEAEQGSEGTAVPAEAAAAALEARLATLKEAVAGEQAAVAQERRQVQIAAANLAAREAKLEVALEEMAEAEQQLYWQRRRLDPNWRDWAGGLPAGLLEKVAGKVVAQTEAGWAAHLKEVNPTYWTEERIQEEMAERKHDGNCLFVFARVCKEWRKAQLKVGGPLRTRVESDVLLPGRAELAKWALAEGCPRPLSLRAVLSFAPGSTSWMAT